MGNWSAECGKWEIRTLRQLSRLEAEKRGGLFRQSQSRYRVRVRLPAPTLTFSRTHPTSLSQQGKMAAAVSQMAALNASFAGAKVTSKAKTVSTRGVSARAVTPVRAALAAPADVSADTVMDCVNTVRFLAIDAINKSNSGHPGLPMGCAPMGYVIYREAMTHNPKNYQWFNRDRFVLSAGHGCMLQYSLMHLTGYPSVSVRDKPHFLSFSSVEKSSPPRFRDPVRPDSRHFIRTPGMDGSARPKKKRLSGGARGAGVRFGRAWRRVCRNSARCVYNNTQTRVVWQRNDTTAAFGITRDARATGAPIVVEMLLVLLASLLRRKKRFPKRVFFHFFGNGLESCE
jgi:hypothetical protein